MSLLVCKSSEITQNGLFILQISLMSNAFGFCRLTENFTFTESYISYFQGVLDFFSFPIPGMDVTITTMAE
jgi:hypothetical protein